MTAAPTMHQSLWRRWVVQPIVTQLSQGTEPRMIARAIAWGMTIGVFPLLGTPTLVSIPIGIALKLNQPVLQVFRELAYPLHLATILLFIRAGEALFGVPHTSLSLAMMVQKFGAGPTQFLRDYGMLGLYAVTAWALLAPVLLAVIYGVSLPLVKGISNRLSRHVA